MVTASFCSESAQAAQHWLEAEAVLGLPLVDTTTAASHELFDSTTGLLCGCCLSQFQICVCVSGIAHLLSVSKFSLCQSASIVTKSLSSAHCTGAGFHLKKKKANSCVFIY